MILLRFFLFVFSLTIISCQDSKRNKLLEDITKWQDKTIIFPDSMLLTSYKKDSSVTKYDNKVYSYTILNYVDTLGCVSCRLQISRWNDLINKFRINGNDSVRFLMVFNTNNKNRFIRYLRDNEFDHFVFMDDSDTINRLNNFSTEESFHTMLLDKNNKVLAVGNPVLNLGIRNLYLSIILNNEVKHDANIIPQTEIKLSTNVIDWGNFQYNEHQKSKIIITNVGVNILNIEDIISSCDCINVRYDKKYIRIGESVTIEIDYKAEVPELINEGIRIFCNAPNSPFVIRIKGNAYE